MRKKSLSRSAQNRLGAPFKSVAKCARLPTPHTRMLHATYSHSNRPSPSARVSNEIWAPSSFKSVARQPASVAAP